MYLCAQVLCVCLCMYVLRIVSPDKILHCLNTVIVLITCAHVFLCACKRDGGAERAM